MARSEPEPAGVPAPPAGAPREAREGRDVTVPGLAGRPAAERTAGPRLEAAQAVPLVKARAPVVFEALPEAGPAPAQVRPAGTFESYRAVTNLLVTPRVLRSGSGRPMRSHPYEADCTAVTGFWHRSHRSVADARCVTPHGPARGWR